MTEKQNAEMLELADKIEASNGLILLVPGQGTVQIGIRKTALAIAALRAAAAPSPHPTREEPVAGAYLYEPAERGRLCVIRYKAPHYTGCGDVVARNVELDLAQRIVGLLNAAPPPADATLGSGGAGGATETPAESSRGDEWIAPGFGGAYQPPAEADAVREIACHTCGGSGFSGHGTGYDDVCSECGGQRYLPAPQPQEKPECTCGGDPDQPASHHDISCPAAFPDDQRGEK